IRGRWTAGGTFALGMSAALMTMVRAQDALFAIGPALDFCASTSRSALGVRRSMARSPSTAGAIHVVAAAFAGLVGFTLAYLPQLLAFKALNGRFRQSDYETRKMTWTSPHGLQVLF